MPRTCQGISVSRRTCLSLAAELRQLEANHDGKMNVRTDGILVVCMGTLALEVHMRLNGQPGYCDGSLARPLFLVHTCQDQVLGRLPGLARSSLGVPAAGAAEMP